MPLLEASILRGSNAARGHSTMRFVRLLGLCPLGAGLLGCRRRRRCCATHAVLIGDACNAGRSAVGISLRRRSSNAALIATRLPCMA